jgi:hypothetical protein
MSLKQSVADAAAIPAEWLAEFDAAARRPLVQRFKYAFIRTYKPVWTTPISVHSTRRLNTASGATTIFPLGSAMGAFEYRQAEEIRDCFARHGVQYLFLGKSGASLLGFPDTKQVAYMFVKRSEANGASLVAALLELGVALTDKQRAEAARGKDFVQLKNGPFELDLIFAPDGIESFDDAWQRHLEVEGFPVCHLDDIIASKEATGRVKDRESLPRLRAFREYWRQRPRS